MRPSIDPVTRRVFLGGSLSLAAVALGACSAPSAPGTSDTAGAGGMVSGEISLLTALIPESLNPVAGFANTGKGKINESLLTLKGSPDTLPEIVPHLASAEPEISADGRTWTVRLTPGISFSDGSPLTAADVVATYEAIVDPASASPIAGDLVNLAKVEATGEHTVAFTLKQPQVSFRTALLIGIAPQAMLPRGQKVEDSPLNQRPVGTGPYVVESYSTDRLILAANPGYRHGAPQVSKVTYALAADDNTRAQRMQAGDFDGSVLPPRLSRPFRTSSTMDVITATSADWRGLSLPAGNPVTADPAVRKALNVGIDRAAIVSGVLVGLGRPAHTFIPPQYGEYYDPAAVFRHDPAGAKAMLDAAGWSAGADGIRVKDSTRAAFRLLYRPTDLIRRDLSAAFASEALKLGFDVTIEGVDIPQTEPRIDQDAVLFGGGDTPYDVDTQVYKNLHSSYPAAGTFYDNASHFKSAAMDAALDTGRTSLDRTARVAAYRKVQQLYIDEPSTGAARLPRPRLPAEEERLRRVDDHPTSARAARPRHGLGPVGRHRPLDSRGREGLTLMQPIAHSPRLRWRRAGRLVQTRLLVAAPVVTLVSLATFWLASISPFDPLVAYLGARFERTSVAQREVLAQQLGMDDSWYAIWWRWATDVILHGDWGQSRSLARPVATVLAERLPWTLLLGGAGMALAIGLSLVLGVQAARRPGLFADRIATGMSYALQGIPPFVVALIAIAVFSLLLGWLPVAGVAEGGGDPTWESIARHLILPATVLGASQVPWLLLNVRTSVLESLGADHVRAARSRGLPEHIVVWRHALPTALLPFITVIGARLPEVVTGALLVETVFSWPGLASATVDAATSMDFPLLAAVTILTSAAVLLGSMCADALYLLLDPRVDHA